MHDDLTTIDGAMQIPRPRTVIVTGGTQGIGADIAVAFARNGDRVFACARNAPAPGVMPSGVEFLHLEAQDRFAHQSATQRVIDLTGSLDVFINNVGYSAWKSIEGIDEDFLEKMLSVNLKSAFWGSQAAAKHMTEGGSILNISSLAGKRGTANNSAYVAAKFGMNGLTQSLAKELGPRGIRVNALCPVLVRTPGLMSALQDSASPGAADPESYLTRFMEQQSALGRLPTGREVADMAVALCDPKSSAITGQCVNVDCGALPQ